uniref:ECSIT N-terminal domain-containing protein n=1 Tax=Glossina palpalis gambiensis TaxID=67801 RepID=A0A1B0BJI3_9MUSC
MVNIFSERDKRRRNHVEFIYAAMKHLAEFRVERNLDVYKALKQMEDVGVRPDHEVEAMLFKWLSPESISVNSLTQFHVRFSIGGECGSEGLLVRHVKRNELGLFRSQEVCMSTLQLSRNFHHKYHVEIVEHTSRKELYFCGEFVFDKSMAAKMDIIHGVEDDGDGIAAASVDDNVDIKYHTVDFSVVQAALLL